MHRRLTAALALAAATGLTSSAVAAAAQVYFGGDVAGLVRARPASIHITSDENLRAIHWTKWGGATAKGSGTAVFSASDGIPPTAVALTLTNRHRCAGKLRYLTLRIAPRHANVAVLHYTCKGPQ